MKTTKYRIASILMFVHGGLMEIGGCLALIPLILFQSGDIGAERFFSFIVPCFQDNLILMAVIGAIYGAVRVIGGIGLLKNRMWGLVLSIINCVVTMCLMPFMLPAGIIDGLLACTALVLILTAYFGDKQIQQ